MKPNIHPKYEMVTVSCGCGSEFQIRSTMGGNIERDVCDQCHSFYTGKGNLIDRAGRVEQFRQRFGNLGLGGKAEPSS